MSSINHFEYMNNNNNETKSKFPYEICKIDPDLNRKILQDFTGERTGFVQVGPKKYFFPQGYSKEAENLYNFQTRPGDVFVVSFPRSGTTWTQEMVWLLGNDLNFEKAKNVSLNLRFPFFEYSCFLDKEVKQELLDLNRHDEQKFQIIQSFDDPAWKYLSQIDGPRFVKTHMPFSLLPQNIFNTGCKVIYVARHPKDVAVSFYHLNRSMRTQGFLGDFPKYWHYFKNNLQPWTPYWEHIKEAWSRRNEENFLFLFYEELNKDLLSGIKKVSNFLGKQYSDEELAPLVEHLKIDNFRKNPAVNSEDLRELGIILKDEAPFVRKGKSGGWKDYFVDDLNDDADKWIEDNLKGTDLKFPSFS